MKLSVGVRRAASACMLPLARRATRAYIAGETLQDALAVARRLAGDGLTCTFGYWDSAGDSATQVAEQYLAALDSTAGSQLDSYMSIKLPALRFDGELLAQVADRARQLGIRLHCDSHGPEVVDQSWALIDSNLPAQFSTTLPGRWARSIADADRAIERGLIVRVVKGQWPDPADPRRDPRAGFLQVIDHLAGRARHVAVASHDVPLATEAIRRLQTAGTPCQLELLYGLPINHSLRMAQQLGVSTRVYIPYGAAYLPYALSRIRGNPRMMWWLVKDLMTARRG